MGNRNFGHWGNDSWRDQLGYGCGLIPNVLPGLVLGAILRLPTCYQDRHDERVFDHLTRIAYAISEEAKDVDEAAALVAIGKHESGFCLAVQDHSTHSSALSSWQLEGKSGKYPGPFLGLEMESIHNAAHAAVDIYRHSWQCGPTFSDRVTAYAARPCHTIWPSLKAREGTFWFVRSVIAKGI